MKIPAASLLAAVLLLLLPGGGACARGGGRVGLGYSGFPIAGGLGTLRYDSYGFYFEGGFRFRDRIDSELTFGSKIAFKPWEYYSIPVELGGAIAFVTNGTTDKDGSRTVLTDLGIFVGLGTLVTDQVAVGVAFYPIALGLGGAETLTDVAPATVNVHFLF